MGIPYNRTAIIRLALSLLGFGLIQSIEAGGPAAAALNDGYDALMAADLSSPNWRFATKVQVISEIAGVDPDFIGFNYAYQIPPDCLAIWQLWPNVPYEQFGERLWTTTSQQFQLQYRAIVPESMMPPVYLMYFAYLLAQTYAPGIAKDDTVFSRIDAGMTRWRAQAMLVNSQGRPNQALSNSTWIGSRASGTFYGIGVIQ